jgi:hypothetical protein
MFKGKEQEEASSFVSVNTLVGASIKPKEFHYIVRQGDGYWSLARYIMKNSGRLYIVQQEATNNTLVEEVAEAIRADLVNKGRSNLNVGDVLLLKDVGYYVPRLRLLEDDGEIREPLAEAKSAESREIPLSQNPREIEEKLLTNNDVYGTRRDIKDIKAIVLHQTYSTTADSAISWFNKGAGSTQYIIDKDGTIIQLLPDSYSGFHIRKGYEKTWVNNLNSIGIEFVGMAYGPKNKEVYEDITLEQQAAGTWLMKELMSKYNISRDNIFKHPEVQAKNRTEAQSVEIPY